VVAPVTVASAGLTLLLHVVHLATRGHLAVLADDTTAGECGEAEQSDQTHHTLRLESNTCARDDLFRAEVVSTISLRNLRSDNVVHAHRRSSDWMIVRTFGLSYHELSA